MLAPGASQDVSITFSPCEARLYREEIPFNINGLYTVRVAITGEGSPLKLELANAAHRSLNLGAVSRGGQTSKSVQVSPRQHVGSLGHTRPGGVTHHVSHSQGPPVLFVVSSCHLSS